MVTAAGRLMTWGLGGSCGLGHDSTPVSDLPPQHTSSASGAAAATAAGGATGNNCQNKLNYK